MDNELEKIINKYKNGYISKRELLKIINPIILSIPLVFKFYDEDIKHDYYAGVISKIDKILESYKNINNASFKTWFIIVLKRNFITYLRIKGYKDRKNKNIESYYDYINSFECVCDFPDICDKNLNNVIPDFEILSYNERAVISYKYGYNLINADLHDAAEIILNKIEKKKKLEYKIEKRYMKGIILQKIINEEYSEDIKQKLILEEKSNREYKSKLEKEFFRFNIYPTNKWVASKLGIKEGTISAYLNRIKEKLNKNILKKQKEVLFGS